MFYILDRHCAPGAEDAVTYAQLFKGLAEGMHVARMGVSTRNPLLRYVGEGGRRPLQCDALHVMEYAADATHLLPTAGASGAAVNQIG